MARQLPKPTNDPDNIVTIDAESVINKKTGIITRKKKQDPFTTSFTLPGNVSFNIPSMGSGMTPEFVTGHIECERIREKIRNIQKSIGDRVTTDDLMSVFYNDVFPRHSAFRCSDWQCTGCPPMQHITQMILHGERVHKAPANMTLEVILDIVNNIEKR